MALHPRTELAAVLRDIEAGNRKQVYLVFGERYLCRQTAEELEQTLLESNPPGAVHSIDGALEDEATLLSRLVSFSLLPGLQIYRVADTRLFLSKQVGAAVWEKVLKASRDGKPEAASRQLQNLLVLGGVSAGETGTFSDIAPDQWRQLFGFSHPGGDLSWADRLVSGASSSRGNVKEKSDRFSEAVASGFPANNILLLLTENVDKRKKLFTQIKKHGEIIDCSVSEGASRAAVQQQRQVIGEMASRVLAEHGKKMAPEVLEALFERVGFHPAAAVMELEKLALYDTDRRDITLEDLDLLVSRTREDAIFELTEALGARNPARTLKVLNHLISDGMHSLAVLAALRNYFRKLLIFKSLQARTEPPWSPRLNPGEFQHRYLPALRETGLWPELLKGHPYGLYLAFNQAAAQDAAYLRHGLEQLLEAEFRLKGSPIPAMIVLEELLISMVRAAEKRAHGSAARYFPLLK